MKPFWRLHRHRERPDLAKTEAELDRILGQRAAVEELVADLRREKHLNNFTANVTITFQGGRR